MIRNMSIQTGILFGMIVAAAPALAHNHLTVDTGGGNAGDKIIIKAGYYPDEAAYTISNGRLYYNGNYAVYHVTDQLVQSDDLDGWYAGDELLLTSDFFFGTGRLDGGTFMYELQDIRPVFTALAIESVA